MDSQASASLTNSASRIDVEDVGRLEGENHAKVGFAVSDGDDVAFSLGMYTASRYRAGHV